MEKNLHEMTWNTIDFGKRAMELIEKCQRRTKSVFIEESLEEAKLLVNSLYKQAKKIRL
ncbi:hypothetical protein LCGC14_1115870 [marine sediment metagenome]|uniref:Uncharacterized protein n=1 Tax=marine sediment metagenome TaxID=412755 RepID=A0A0F9MTC8_9ZZZZ